jgi:diguanylate cyclase (GGDEF)-like protein
MKFISRQDLWLLAGFSAALIIVFSSPLTRLLDYARGVERQTGLTLLPALVVLAAVFLVHQLRKGHEARERAQSAEVAKRLAEERAGEFERLVSFGQALGQALDFDSIRLAIAQHLARIAGTDRFWVLVRQGTQWEALSGERRGTDDAMKWGDVAEQLLAGSGHPGDGPPAVGFPLIVAGTAVGVLGVRSDEGSLAPERRSVIDAAVTLLAVSVKNAQLVREVRENSVRDPLTSCFTRGHAFEVIDAEMRRARRSQAPVSVIMFDLDHFREVNDRYGHLCGDAVLAAVGKRMREVLRGSDLKCRYSGEQFLVLLPETPIMGTRRVAETLRRELAERPMPWAGESLTITASFGIAQALPGEVNVQAVIARADQALRRAKDEGRNCVRSASDGPGQPIDEGRRTTA